MAGKVWLVGAGPGDPGLFTLKGRSVLEAADVVVYDALVGQGVLGMIPPRAELINVGKRASNHTMPQEQINQVLLEEARKGKQVVRLKGGDPFLFGRGGEELELLVKENIPFEVVPGVTSAVAVPAYNGIRSPTGITALPCTLLRDISGRENPTTLIFRRWCAPAGPWCFSWAYPPWAIYAGDCWKPTWKRICRQLCWPGAPPRTEADCGHRVHPGGGGKAAGSRYARHYRGRKRCALEKNIYW